MNKIYVKTNKKTGGVAEILWAGSKDQVTPSELKETLNMFRGQQFPKCFKKLIEYAEVSLRAQEGNREAEFQLRELNVSFNRKDNED